MSKDIINILKESFPNSKFELLQEHFGGEIFCFFILTESESEIELSWEKITNKIGVYFQSKLESEFEIWNLYLFFISSNSVNKDLKHKIEHDTVSSRKIVVENYKGDFDNQQLNALFQKYIAFDMRIKTSEHEKIQVVEKNTVILNALKKIQEPSTKQEHSKYIDKVLDEISNRLKDEI